MFRVLGWLTPRGSGALLVGGALLATGIAWRYPGLIAFGAGLLLLATLGLVSVAVPVPISLERTVFPVQVARYGTCTATLRVRHKGSAWPVTLDAVDHLDGEPLPVQASRLRPGETKEMTYAIPTLRRGVRVVGRLVVHRHGIAGLARRTISLGDTVNVHVLPRTLTVRTLPAGVRRNHDGTTEQVERGGTDLVGLREYTPGDDLRRLHWATSARTGTLMIREDADPARPQLAVLLDDRISSYRNVDVDFEDAVEVASSLVSAAIEAGSPVRLRTVSGGVDVEISGLPGSDDAAAIASLFAALADVAGTPGDDRPAAVLPHSRDVVAVISGTLADAGSLVLVAASAVVGVVLLVDLRYTGRVDTADNVLVLRGPRAEELLELWDRGMVP
ncbi:DUF58 domain-containing protein [Kibdelosporangium persicum]|uniref:DUF58 domain-containing protein n=1 Tax=Kibdelosporangium persicum TaxID=2698649 RepID=A0ABX2FBI7_9PSEU|nr:DUF58 domain-containing protein [Kibdelosporangium persicum]NRN68749.1 DUF58 domain-containing protein [Kibdelosporangium persicum]